MKRVLVHLFESPAVFGFLCLILFRAPVLADTILPITLAESDKQQVNNPMNFTPGTLLLCEQGDTAIQFGAGYVCGTMTQGIVIVHAPSDVIIWTAVAGGGTNSLFCSDQDVSKGGDDDPACATYARNGLPTSGNFAVPEPVKTVVGGPETFTYSPGVGNPGYGRFDQGSGNFLLAQYTLTSDPASLPEPPSVPFVAAGLIGLALIRRRFISRWTKTG